MALTYKVIYKMEEKTNNLTTVAYSKNRAKELSSICKKLGISKTQFIDFVIHQFYRTGEDPREPIKESLPKKLTAIENRIIGFIKTQDKEYLQEIIKALAEQKQNNKEAKNSLYQKIDELDFYTQDRGGKTITRLDSIHKSVSTFYDDYSIFTKKMNEQTQNYSKNIRAIDNNLTSFENIIKLTDQRKSKAIEELKAKKNKLGLISIADAIEIISKM